MSDKDKPQSGAQTDAVNMTDEAFNALQQDIKALYQQQDLERPSAAIDAAILLQAKAVKGAGGDKTEQLHTNVVPISFWKKHRLPLSSAASVMLIASVMLLNPDFSQHAKTELDDSMPVMADTAVPTPTPAMMRSGPLSNEQPSTQSSAQLDIQPSIQSSNQSTNEASNSVDVIKQEQTLTNSTQPKSAQQLASQAQTKDQTQANVQAFDMQIPNDNAINNERAGIEMNQAEMQVIEEFASKEQQSLAAPVMQHDSATKAIGRLNELVKNKDYVEAERYMLTIEQRFPDIVNPTHPQHEQYTELKQLLTAK
ncbi:hypothetical protein [Shewanella goraebulensis]|uniref:hypothetical protein n=1 Tax=Shewanella goraebulensis TaxID=3050637 RepID=UPI00254E9151|nr:hypothetical protein [Shewanella goraebulensis]